MRGVGPREVEGAEAPCQQACDQEQSDLSFPCIPSFPGVSLILRPNWQSVVPARLFQTLALGAKASLSGASVSPPVTLVWSHLGLTLSTGQLLRLGETVYAHGTMHSVPSCNQPRSPQSLCLSPSSG